MSVLKAKDPVTGEWLPVGSGSGGSSGSSGIPVPETAEVGQTIVVKSVDANGKPTAWECVDLPSGGSSGSDFCGIVTAFFDGQDESTIFCISHDHDTLLQDIETYPTIAHVTIYGDGYQKVITTMCWVDENRMITVGEYFGDAGWKWHDGDGYLSEY